MKTTIDPQFGGIGNMPGLLRKKAAGTWIPLDDADIRENPVCIQYSYPGSEHAREFRREYDGCWTVQFDRPGNREAIAGFDTMRGAVEFVAKNGLCYSEHFTRFCRSSAGQPWNQINP